MASLLDSLRQVKQIENYSDVSAFICSQQTQQQRIKKWNDFWDKHRDEVQEALKLYAPQYEFSEEAFSGFTEIISAQYSAHPFEYFSPLVAALFNRSFSNSTGKYSVVDIIEVGGLTPNPSRAGGELGESRVSRVESLINQYPSPNTQSHYSFDFVGMNSAVANALYL